MNKIPFVFWIVLLLFLINSCNLDSFDFNKLSNEVNLNPSVVAPVAKAKITVWDLLQSANDGNDDVITKDPLSGIIKIVYNQNDLFQYNVRDFLDFPRQQDFTSGDKQLGEISPGDITVSRNITLSELTTTLGGGLESILPYNGMTVPFPAYSFSGPAARYSMVPITDYTSVTLSNGSIEIILENNLEVPVTITGNLYDLAYNRKIADFTFTGIDPNSISKKLVSLIGVQISSQVEFRMEAFETTGSSAPVFVDLADYIQLDFNLIDLVISSGNLMVESQTIEGYSGEFSFVFPEPDLKAFGAVLKNGSLTLKASNSSELTGAIHFTLPEIKKNGVSVTASVPLSGNSVTIDLSGADINFASDPAAPFNRIPYTYSLYIDNSNGYINFNSTDAIKMDVSLNNLDFKSIHGDFGNRTIQIDPDIFDLNVDLLDKIDGSFKLANPKLELIIRNSIGMPATVSLDFTASNKAGETEALNPPVFDIPVPANINAGIETGSIVFDKLNSNIVNFIALPPTGQISYSGQVDFNKSGEVTAQNPNFLDTEATFAIDLAMELPMELQISNLAFNDTSGISGDNFDNFESADLIINAKNGIPLDIDMQLLFVDTISKRQYGTSKKSKIMTAALVDASGIITPVQSSQTISLDKNDMDNLRKSNGIVFSGSVSSPSGGTGVATIKADSEIELNVVIKSKFNL